VYSFVLNIDTENKDAAAFYQKLFLALQSAFRAFHKHRRQKFIKMLHIYVPSSIIIADSRRFILIRS